MSGQREKKLDDMLCLDVFLMSLDPSSATAQRHREKAPQRKQHCLLCRDAGSMTQSSSVPANGGAVQPHEQVLLKALQDLHQWENNVEHLLHNHDYEALVLTDHKQVIRWVDWGFAKMTGYPPTYAIGRYPKFLQGRNTSPETRNRIRKGLKGLESFTEVIVNQRKNREEYKCEITIFPLRNQQKQVTHFLALENEIK